MEDRLTGRLFSHGEYTEERRGTTLKRINWVLIVLVLIGFVIGRFIGTYFDGTFLNYGQNFGLSSPVELNLGFIILTFGLEFNITIASVIGVIIAISIGMNDYKLNQLAAQRVAVSPAGSADEYLDEEEEEFFS
mgnify:CR=1 FL=1